MNSRRRALATLLLAGALPGARAEEANIPFVDAHVHLNDEALQLQLMDRHGATKAVVFWGGLSDNRTVVEAARRHPGRFIPFASISPERTLYRPMWEADDTSLLHQLEALLATGFYKGIGEISVAHFASAGFGETDFSPMGATTRGIMELARKYQLPVLVHIEVTRLAELSQMLSGYADVHVIWAHGGYTPLFLAQRMLANHPNLHYELSARTWPRHPRSPDYTILRDGQKVWPEWLQLIERQPHRFIIGTDASGRSAASDHMKFESVQNVLRQLGTEARALVGQRNILKLVGEA